MNHRHQRLCDRGVVQACGAQHGAGGVFGVFGSLPAFRLSSDRTFLSRAGWQANKKYEYEKRECRRRGARVQGRHRTGAGDDNGAAVGGSAIHAVQQTTGFPRVSTAETTFVGDFGRTGQAD
jgi:hypothetical protein